MSARLLSLALLSLLACKDTAEPVDSEVVAGDDSGPVDADGDGFLAGEDCDDSDAGIYPDAVEICDGVDNNCDGAVDEGVTTTFYGDADADGYGADAVTEEACSAPEGFVEDGGDCDDADPDYNPGAPETDCADPNDYNCDGSVGYADSDGDGWAACEECDDDDSAVNPDAIEVCDDIDNDCDGATDDADSALDLSTASDWYHDGDNDGYGDASDAQRSCEARSGYVADSSDCDDSDGAVYPGATEVCNDVDDDCDGDIDDADASLDASTAATWYDDDDRDGYGDASASQLACDQPSGAVSDSSDCDDSDSDVNPGETEICNDIDDDCDGDVDDDDASLSTATASTWYDDDDGDGYGDASASQLACDQPSGAVSDSSDCDDGDGAVNPSETEVCNGVDDDCDGDVDDDDASVDLSTGATWYADADADGYGDASVSTLACDQPNSYTSDSADCNDADASLFPESDGTCASGASCKQLLDDGFSTGDGTYTIDPDGAGTGLDPFDVTCDMTTDGGGWTEIAYSADLTYRRQFTNGDRYQWLSSDFSLVLSDSQIDAIRAVSSEGSQRYVGLCNHVIHWYYTAGSTYGYAFGFELHDGSTTPYGQQSYSPYSISVTQDNCRGNGGEGGTLANATIFEISDVGVPVINVYSRDSGDSGEYFGSPLTSYPAYLR